MHRYFNTAGACNPREHHMLPPERRLGPAMELIEEARYFVLYAGHQTGKTTSAQWLVDHYNAGARHRCLWIDIQSAREIPELPEAMRTILNNMGDSLYGLPDLPRPDVEELLKDPATALLRYLRQLSVACAAPLVVFFDEADGLIGRPMVSFLTQLRQGYIARAKTPFPHSVVLVGRRQVRDYTVSLEERRAISWLGTSSPFNITAEATTLVPFREEEVGELLAQHTAETGQVFLPEAAARIFELSCGQPWLVNALADQVVRRDVPDRGVAITTEHIDSAKETLIVERRTHIDALVARLREPRIMRILDPMLAGENTGEDVLDDDFAYAVGLGLLARRAGRFEVANPIYREVLPRALTFVRQSQIANEPAWYLTPEGRLDMPKLMAAWQEYWRKDGHVSVLGQKSYREAGPHIMLMAFLQRIVNGGGHIEREYALGRGALDLLIEVGGERHAIEVKVRRDTSTEADALVQVSRYLGFVGLKEGWLVLFDMRKGRAWKQKLTHKRKKKDGHLIHVIGC